MGMKRHDAYDLRTNDMPKMHYVLYEGKNGTGVVFGVRLILMRLKREKKNDIDVAMKMRVLMK